MQRIKDVPLFRIERLEFQYVASTDISHHHVVAEKQSAWIAGRNAGRLEAGLRKHEHLGICVHAKILEDAFQVSESGSAVVELRFSALKPLVKPSHRIGDRSIA